MRNNAALKLVTNYNLFLILYVFFTVFFPYSLNVVRLGLLIGLFVFAMLKIDAKVNLIRLIPFLVFWIHNWFSFAQGVVLDNPGSVIGFRHDILWAIVLCISFLGIDKRSILLSIEKVLIYVTFILCVMDVLAIISSTLGVSIPVFASIIRLQIFQVTYESADVYAWFRAWHMSTYIFTIPFSIAMFFSNGYVCLGLSKRFMTILILLEGISVAMSFRTALILIVVASVFFSLMLCVVCKNSNNIKMLRKIIVVGLALVVIVIVANNYLPYSFNEIIKAVQQKLTDSYAAGSTSVRKIMHDKLINAWKQSPIIGWGMGASVPGFTRDDVAVWAYESFYHDILFKKGIIGAVILLFLFFWIAYSLYITAKKDKNVSPIFIPIIVGFVCMVIGVSEDPYFTTLGNLWALYLPYAVAYNKEKFALGDDLLEETK